MTEDSWAELVAALALDQQLVATLITRHVADGRGSCRVCHVRWRCGIRQLADRAVRGRLRQK